MLDHFEYRVDSFSINPEGNFFSVICNDAAALHALLSAVATFRNVQVGIEDQIAMVYHGSEAVRLINEKLADQEAQLSTLLIATVAALVIAEAAERNFDRASIHMRGLATMVELRGGLQTFDHCKVIQRLIAWADLSVSSAWDMPLSFPLLPSSSKTLTPSSDQLISETAIQFEIFGPSNVLMPSTSVLESLQELRSISRAISATSFDRDQRVAISDSIYVVEHQLLSLQFPHTERCSTRIDPSHSLCLAALIYLHLAIRELPLRAKRYRGLIERLFDSLRHHRDLSTLVSPEMSLCFFLWTFFLGATASIGYSFRSFFVDGVVQVSAALQIRSYPDFERCLKKVVWLDRFCRPYSAALWDEIGLHNRLVGL
ncbi:hypothetical protein CDV55_105936 [Aspergillus turcosus]|nr:hypothetical protein CDV55_105936 [Aspergillus turcosus]